MWVVYFSALHEGERGHTYFRSEGNAVEYYNKSIKVSDPSCVHIEEVQTED